MFYLIIFLLFLAQDPISTNAFLLEAYQYHYALWYVHVLFVLATSLDILLGYLVVHWAMRRYPESGLIHRLTTTAKSAVTLTGRYGESVFLLVWGPMIFPLSALIAPLLDIPLRRALPLLLLGDLVLWYGGEWLVVLGVKTVVPDPLLALYAVILVSVLIAVILRRVAKRDGF